MNMPLQRRYRLAERGGTGIVCDANGLSLGGIDLAVVYRDARGARRCHARSPDEIGHILKAAYGPQADAAVARVHRGLCRAAAWVQAGDLGRAGIEALMLGLPDLAPEAMAKLVEIADIWKSAGAPWQTEPRIPLGQTGGGQWTTGGGASATAANVPARSASARPKSTRAPNARKPAQRSSAPMDVTNTSVSARDGNAGPFDAPDLSLLIHVNTAATVVGGGGVAGDFVLPEEAVRLGRMGLLAFGATLLDQWDANSAKKQISAALGRFGLDSSRTADVTAASAYVWSQYVLPFHTDAPFTGPRLDAASQAVMRFALVNPGAFAAMIEKPTPQSAETFSLIIGAAQGGLADYAVESRARPPGVAPELQTTSAKARAAIAEMLKDGNMAAHHLVPAAVWGARIDIAELALKDGWKPDLPSNLIALPRDIPTWEKFGEILPMHIGMHPKYSDRTEAQIDRLSGGAPAQLTPLMAHAILDVVALRNRMQILTGKYNPVLKVRK